MTPLRTYPGAADFHLFTDCIAQCYPSPQEQAVKQREFPAHRHLDSCWVLISEGMPVARAAVYRNPALQYKGADTICIGHYECIPDAAAAAALLGHLEAYAGTSGAGYMIGPMNGSTWEQYRFINEAEQPLFFTEPLHRPYYIQQWEENDWATIGDYGSGLTEDLSVDEEMISSIKTALEPVGIRLRSLDLTAYREELVRLHPFLLQAFSRNFLYTPITLEDFLDKYLPLQPYLKKEFVLLAEDAAGTVAGVFLCIDDLYDTSGRTLIIKTIARDPGLRFRGLGHLMAAQVYREAAARGYTRIIHAFMYNQGTSTAISGHFNGRIFKTYMLFGKTL